MSNQLARHGAERGQVLPLVAVVLLVVTGAAVALVALGGVLAERGEARTAADAAALVAAVDTDEAAAAIAAANGAELVSVYRAGHQVEVVVRVGRATARARAEAVHGTGADARATADGPDPVG